MTTSTLQLACPTCGKEIWVEWDIHPFDPKRRRPQIVSLRTWCFCPLSRKETHDLLMDYGARQAELATERAGERTDGTENYS